jgi:hypothetical protein
MKKCKHVNAYLHKDFTVTKIHILIFGVMAICSLVYALDSNVSCRNATKHSN